MVKVTFEFESNADAAEFLLSLDSEPEAGTEGTEVKAKGKPRGRPRKTDAAPSPAAPAAAPAAAAPVAPAAATPAPAPSTASPAVPVKDVVDAVSALADLNGAHYEKAKAILGKYGAQKLDQLKPEHYGAVADECKAAMPRPSASSLI